MNYYTDIADALAAADWSNTSIGNKALILAAIDRLGTASRENYRLRAGLHTARGALLGYGAAGDTYANGLAEQLATVLDPSITPALRGEEK